MTDIADLVYLARTPTVQEYQELRHDAGWELLPDSVTQEALTNSLCAVTVVNAEGQAIGTGRIVGDGGLQVFLTDILVRRQWQNQGIGTNIVEYLMRHITNHVLPSAFVGLFSAQGRHHFYERHGFVVRPNKNYGPGMMLVVPKAKESANQAL